MISVDYLLGRMRSLIKRQKERKSKPQPSQTVRTISGTCEVDAVFVVHSEPVAINYDVILGFSPDGQLRRM